MAKIEAQQNPGPVCLFPNKIRKPATMTFTAAHHHKINKNMRRLGLTRADFIALLVEKYADTVTV